MAQTKEQNRTPEKELSDVELANLSDTVQNIGGQNAQRNHWIWQKHREEIKVLLREIKKNPQETNGKGKEARIQINDLECKEEINIQPEQNEETRIQKMRRI